ncbi:hypothetical protein CHH80_10215 [Bacillus sp. 7504-2]|nr:hypothetical protein CHH80_10215 [Bacillus sp. 7504-2]
MDKAIMIGTFEFLGFHFTKKMLEEGMEVVGVHFNKENNESFLIEEKRLQIGRNANFVEEKFNSFKGEGFETAPLIIDYYDFFMQTDEDQIVAFTENQLLLQNRDKIILLLPLSIFNEEYRDARNNLKKLVSSAKKQNQVVQEFFLPTVYGPWQSEVFLFQQAFVKKRDEWNITAREWTADALYVEDVVANILKLMEKDEKRYILRNAVSEAWEKCAKSLEIKETPVRTIEKGVDGCEVIIKEAISFEMGLKKQKKVIEMLGM